MSKKTKTMAVKNSASQDVSYKGKGALDAFLNLLSLIALAWMSWAVGRVFFSLIEKYFDKVNFYDSVYYQSQIKYGLASLLVITPIYYGILYLLHKKYQKNELNHNSAIYRWLTYLMLLVSSLAIIGSLITLIQKFLNGDYTIPFMLKVLTVIVIAIFIFGYYFYDLKRRDYSKYSPISLGVGLAVLVIILFGLVVGFMSVDTPNKARLRNLDSKLEQALNELTFKIVTTYQVRGLDDSYNLKEMMPIVYENLADDNLSYRKVSDEQFELCVNFNFETKQEFDQKNMFELPWLSHQAGRQCYVIDAKKQADNYFKDTGISDDEFPAAFKAENQPVR